MCERNTSFDCEGDLPVQRSKKFDYCCILTFIVACGAENITNVNKMIQPFLGIIVKRSESAGLRFSAIHAVFLAPHLAFCMALGRGTNKAFAF